MNVAGAIARSLVFVYRYGISPILPGCCRFTPSCSHYADEAIARHGAWRGGCLTLRRLARCHPFGGYGWDPVPEPSERADRRTPTVSAPRRAA